MKEPLHRVDLIIDGKEITMDAQSVTLKINGVPVYKSKSTGFWKEMEKVGDLHFLSIQALLKAADAAFSHTDRFRIFESLLESPKAYNHLKKDFEMTSANLNYHLKRLIDGWIAYKADNGKYATTILGELLLKHFRRFNQEVEHLQRKVQLTNAK